jgi:nucleotide-binding universal stress UspA family protein
VSVWVGIALVVGGLVAVALVILAADVARGDVGGGRHTMQRARRILVVATDEETTAEADRWIEQQRGEHPQLQCFVLTQPEGQALFMAIEDVIDRERPDAVVMARHSGEHTSTLSGTYARLRDELRVPVDAIYVGERQ